MANPFYKPLEQKAKPTTDKAAVLKLARAAGVNVIHQKYRDIKDSLKSFFKPKQVEAPRQEPRETIGEPLQGFMQRQLAAKATAAQEAPPSTILPSGSAATVSRPPAPITSSARRGGSGNVLGQNELTVCHLGAPAYRLFNCSDAYI